MINRVTESMPSAALLVVNKASLRSNNELLEANSTQETAKRAVLGGYSYPEFRLTS